MSEFYIYNTDMVRVAILQNYESIQWLENYQSAGEVKVVARVTDDNLLYLAEGNRIYNTDSDAIARISHVDIVEGKRENSIVARADLTVELLSDRVLMGTERITNVEQGMYAIYRNNRRDLPIEIATPAGFEETIDSEMSWNSVLEAEISLATASGLGFRVVYDPAANVETFLVYKGVDRTDITQETYVGHFGTKIGNIANAEIASGSTDLKNVAVVAGEGEGAARAVRIVSLGTVTGENRREIFIDARDIQRTGEKAIDTGRKDPQGNPIYEYQDVTYTPTEYNALLDARGYEKLAEHLHSFDIVCDIEQTGLTFGKDYYLGDRMPIKLDDYGITASGIISSVKRVYEKTGRTVVATLGNFSSNPESYVAQSA